MTCFITYLSKRFLQREEKAKIAKKNIAYMSGKDAVQLSSEEDRTTTVTLCGAQPRPGQEKEFRRCGVLTESVSFCQLSSWCSCHAASRSRDRDN